MQANIGKTFGDFAPPFSKFLNGIILEAQDGSITMEYTVQPNMLNPVGLLHGGVHAAIIDEMTGMLVATLGEPNIFVSSNLYVDFFGKVKLGETIKAVAVVNKRGKTIINAECSLYNAEGKQVSRGVCNLANTGMPAPHHS